MSYIQVGTPGAVQCLWVQETGGRKCWKRYRRCHQQTGRTNKIPMNIWCWVSWLAQCWAYDIMILKKWKSWNLEDSGRKEELAQFEPSSRHIRVFPFRNDSGQMGFWASAGLLRWRRSHCCGCRRWWRFACLLGDSWDASDLSGMILESNF